MLYIDGNKGGYRDEEKLSHDTQLQPTQASLDSWSSWPVHSKRFGLGMKSHLAEPSNLHVPQLLFFRHRKGTSNIKPTKPYIFFIRTADGIDQWRWKGRIDKLEHLQWGLTWGRNRKWGCLDGILLVFGGIKLPVSLQGQKFKAKVLKKPHRIGCGLSSPQ